MKAKAFVFRALADQTNQTLPCPIQMSVDMSVLFLGSIIHHDWLALLEGMILACPATYITAAWGLCEEEGEQAILVQLSPIRNYFLVESFVFQGCAYCCHLT